MLGNVRPLDGSFVHRDGPRLGPIFPRADRLASCTDLEHGASPKGGVHGDPGPAEGGSIVTRYRSAEGDATFGMKDGMAMKPAKLQQEIALFEKKRAELFSAHADEYVLIKGESIVAFFREEQAAIEAGYKQYGNTGFLVRKIAESETPILLTSLNVNVTRC
jgi:hypothetical protein